MKRRQTLPREWLIIDQSITDESWRTIQRLAYGSGILILSDLGPSERRKLRAVAANRAITIADEVSGSSARVHNIGELRRALLKRTPIILLSPIHPTQSHPDWRPQPRMHAAALARLARRKLFALGGMNRKRYAKIAPLGFIGWAGISAFRT